MFRRSDPTRGFTIIEVMFVLAIASVILVILLVAVPNLRRSARNHGRKRFVELAASLMDRYAAEHNGTYPDTAAERCSFIRDYAAQLDGSPGTGPCTNDGSKDCVVIGLNNYSVCFHTRMSSPHEYIGEPDEMSIQLGHYCNKTFDESHAASPSNTYILSTAGSDTDVHRYVIWTALENAPFYCIDNYPD